MFGIRGKPPSHPSGKKEKLFDLTTFLQTNLVRGSRHSTVFARRSCVDI